jgi:hypothetical protein
MGMHFARGSNSLVKVIDRSHYLDVSEWSHLEIVIER